ncbi:DUF1826 domain-containing protein [Paraglaciecola aquimarina]|uniref:DUF1826 domain-containing protein n=1 Tax=Paraglaciecola aquimarina TaxID=1235557 RepID=A0ABU3SUR2_9ALTE|nr:DUF1826 domain-containing protein [Paraglaciecola aquimarina]MDU0353735.1 DUF1826 domain-containing protein [Paraglaciecola aquimarina]
MQSQALIKEQTIASPARRSACAHEASILTDIYDESVNLAVWQRHLSRQVTADVSGFIKTANHLDRSAFIRAQHIEDDVRDELKRTSLGDDFISNTSELVDMFCTLFDLEQVGFRIRLLDLPMCPRSHIDRVPCRLVTTFSGQGTQWLESDSIDRSKLGHGSQGLDDSVSGLYSTEASIRSMTTGDVALLKGSAWIGNEASAIVHRSPPYITGEKRLLLTLDFLS